MRSLEDFRMFVVTNPLSVTGGATPTRYSDGVRDEIQDNGTGRFLVHENGTFLGCSCENSPESFSDACCN